MENQGYNQRMTGRPKRKNPPMRIGDETLGERLARLRKERGFKQSDLAQELETTQSIVSDYENDRCRPHVEMVVALANALELSVDEFLGVTKPKPKKKPGPKSKLDKQFEAIQELPRGKREFIAQMLELAIQQAS